MNDSVSGSAPGVAMLIMAFPPKAIGGAEMQCLRLSGKLVARGVRVHVLTEGGAGAQRFEWVEGIAVHRLSSKHGAWSLRALDALNRAFRPIRRHASKRRDGLPYDPAEFGIRFRNPGREMVRYALFFLDALVVLRRIRTEVDVIHVHIVPWMSFIGALLGWIFHIPVVVKESTMTGARTARQLPFGWMMMAFVRSRCTFIAMTVAIRRELLSLGVRETRIEMIPNGIDPVATPLAERRPFTCLTVGNLTQGAAKGLDVLFRAWVHVLREEPASTLWVAGDGDAAAFDAFLESLGIRGKIEFLGPVPDMLSLYQMAAVVALPSRREGMSNALLEAMVAGAPIVATRVSGAEELIMPGVNGALVDVEDGEALAEKILTFFRDPAGARQQGARARVAVLDACGMDDVVRKHLALYERLIMMWRGGTTP
jgi:glycosyltransferase involved in cell wall biosynthesis